MQPGAQNWQVQGQVSIFSIGNNPLIFIDVNSRCDLVPADLAVPSYSDLEGLLLMRLFVARYLLKLTRYPAFLAQQ